MTFPVPGVDIVARLSATRFAELIATLLANQTTSFVPDRASFPKANIKNRKNITKQSVMDILVKHSKLAILPKDTNFVLIGNYFSPIGSHFANNSMICNLRFEIGEMVRPRTLETLLIFGPISYMRRTPRKTRTN